jgi:hypothetical protein
MLKAAILKFEVAGEKKEATDEDVLNLIGREIKARREAASQFRDGNRFELAEKEDKEAEVLLEFMPPQLTEEEITVIVKEVIAETGAKDKQDVGRVMGAVMPKVKGRADGAIVGKVVNILLA